VAAVSLGAMTTAINRPGRDRPVIARLLAGRVVVVPSNPVGLDPDGTVVRLLPAGQSSGRVAAGWLPAGAHLAMAFGSMSGELLASSSRRSPELAALFTGPATTGPARMPGG
jgi:hypothetical protein